MKSKHILLKIYNLLKKVLHVDVTATYRSVFFLHTDDFCYVCRPE